MVTGAPTTYVYPLATHTDLLWDRDHKALVTEPGKHIDAGRGSKEHFDDHTAKHDGSVLKWENSHAKDILTPVGTPVYALTDGKLGGYVGKTDPPDKAGQEGNHLYIHTKDNIFFYQHLATLAAGVKRLYD